MWVVISRLRLADFKILNRLNKAQKLLKVSKQKDYYKVGGDLPGAHDF